MDSHHAARVLAVGRVAVGVTLLALPGGVARSIGVGSRPGVRLLIRMVGVRDLALGAGTLRALARGRGSRSWVRAGAACDAVDAAVLTTAAGDLGVGTALTGTVVAGGAAALGSKVAADLEE